MNAALPYAVSVQWGRGWHYFEGYYKTEKEAHKVAEGTYKFLLRRAHRKAASPRVLVWQLQRVLPPKIPAGE